MENKIKTLIKTYNKFQQELYGCKATLKDQNLLLATDYIEFAEIDAYDFCVEYNIHNETIVVSWTDRKEIEHETSIPCKIEKMISNLKEFKNFFVLGTEEIQKFSQT